VDISITFRASSGRHCFFLPALVEGRDTPHIRGEFLPCKQQNQSNRERWNLQHSFSGIVGPAVVLFYAESVLAQNPALNQQLWFPTELFTVSMHADKSG
jgi:hypothetical protein